MAARRPLIFAPGVLGSVLEGGGTRVWGSLRECYAGSIVHGEGPARASDVLRAMSVVPKVYAFDVFASFERALLAEGFVAGETWLPFAYDWRLPLRECARLLRDEIVRASDRVGGPVDAMGFSTGGLAVRAAVSCELPGGPGRREMAGRVANVIFAGTPQRGALDGALCLHRGDWLAPMGRWIEPDEMSGVGGAFDSMPWGRDVFCDVLGARLAWDLYDVATWRALSMGIFAGVSRTSFRFVGSHRFAQRSAPDDAMVARFTASLAEARDFHQAIVSDDAYASLSRSRLHIIAGSARPTATSFIVHDGRAHDPKRLPFRVEPAARFGLAAGDGLVDDASMRALPVPCIITRIAGALHRTLITQPALHAAVLAAVTRDPSRERRVAPGS